MELFAKEATSATDLTKKLVGWRDRRAKRMSFHGTHIIKQG